MPIEITVPRLGWSMDEGTFSSWLKNDGDVVQAGEPLFALESDKVTMDVESFDSGVLYLPPDAPKEGDIVVVGQRIGYLLAVGEQPPEATPSPEAAAKTPVTPRARRVAAELGVDTSSLMGTGKDGRVRERDVRAAAVHAPPGTTPVHASAVTEIPLTALRRAIAMRMMECRNNTVPVTLTCRADATALVALRERAKESPADTVPSYPDLMVVLAAQALKAHPLLAARWNVDRIVIPQGIHIGIAVDTPRGLLVPVVRDVPSLTLQQVTRRSRQLIEAARAGTSKGEDLQGGVFTVSNLGSYCIEAFTPVINYPETAILGVGAIVLEPAILAGGQIGARHQLTLSLTFDHRVVDGAPAARFLQLVKQLVESPACHFA